MVVLRDIKVTIAVGGESLEEHRDQNDDTEQRANTVVRYIEIVTETEFSVKFGCLDIILPT